jgi:hypothetical protein
MLLSDIKTLLLPITTSIYLGEMGTTPNTLAIYFAGGSPPVQSFEGRSFERPSFQVRVRHENALTAYQWAEQVKDTLHGIGDTVINSARYIDIMQTGDILPLGKDAQGRTELSINFQTKLDRSV